MYSGLDTLFAISRNLFCRTLEPGLAGSVLSSRCRDPTVIFDHLGIAALQTARQTLGDDLTVCTGNPYKPFKTLKMFSKTDFLDI
jgi:hypothetical protein